MPALRPIVLSALLAACLPVAAAERSVATDSGPRFTLRRAQLERGARTEDRFSLRARLAPAESAGELREGGDFVLLGRLAKAAAPCGSDTLFKNGFEGN